MKKICSAGVIVYRINESVIEYLLLHYLGGHWDFPKGKMEPGETKQETALRELHEETGIITTLDSHFEESFNYIFRDRDRIVTEKTVYFFLSQVGLDQKVKLSFEHQLYSWLDFDQAMYRLTYDNAKKVLEKAQEYIEQLTAQ